MDNLIKFLLTTEHSSVAKSLETLARNTILFLWPHHLISRKQLAKQKELLEQSRTKAKDPYKAMLNYCNTNIEEIGLSPAQMFLGRSAHCFFSFISSNNLKWHQDAHGDQEG